jgi:hypothetical protein
MLSLSACSNAVPKEKKIEENIENYKHNLFTKTESVDKVEISNSVKQ